MVRLDNLVSFEESSSPPELYRYNRYSAATVSGTLAPGRTLAEGIAAFREIAAATLDERFTTSLSGAARDFEESASSLGWVFALALLLIYLVLAAQFESFVDPFVILLTVPLALAGALFALWYFNQTLNIFSQIGLIMLVGLVTKNGILIVEFANQRLAAGAGSALTAVREAAAARLRPILQALIGLSKDINIEVICAWPKRENCSVQDDGTTVVGGTGVDSWIEDSRARPGRPYCESKP